MHEQIPFIFFVNKLENQQLLGIVHQLVQIVLPYLKMADFVAMKSRGLLPGCPTARICSI